MEVDEDKKRKLKLFNEDGKPIYRESKSIFGVQKKMAQIPLECEPRHIKKIREKERRSKCDVDYKAWFERNEKKILIDWYLNEGYDPREIYEPEEDEYKEAADILNELDVRLGRMKKHQYANYKWKGHTIDHIDKKKEKRRRVWFQDDPFFEWK